MLASIPVPGVLSLSEDKLDILSQAYERLAHQNLQPSREMHQDPLRHEIDNTISDVLSLPDVTSLRNILACEPIICLNSLT